MERRWFPIMLAATAVAATACAASDDTSADATVPPPAEETVVDPATTTAAPSAATTTTAPAATTADTAADTTVAETPAPDPAAEATTTTAATTTTVPVTTTTEAIAVQELLLRGDGLGSARFGTDPDAVVEYVTSILGGNTADSGWVDPYTFADCSFASEARKVDWGVLSLIFADQSFYANGRRHFIGWEYGLVSGVGDEPVGLRTPGGTTIGSRVIDLLAEFPEAAINAGEPELSIPANYYVSDVFRGLLTGNDGDDFVTVMNGGYGCFG